MPKRDGTGPEGKGPGTGRRKGNCFGAFYNKKGKFSVWRTMVLPAIGALINDLRKPNGVTRQLAKDLTEKFKEKKSIESKQEDKEIKEANYEVIDSEKGE
ncbi:MAG: DUF5320 domain-containing protein [Candidatus Cloacimonetes bacterium]|nr:DUF5320 domain-containing protein [Candidatus Cloacimonadota bacterium]MBS3767386.1 DUF5320 domain-containing protein [Candidatus Cloacimonadota bacterium]